MENRLRRCLRAQATRGGSKRCRRCTDQQKTIRFHTNLVFLTVACCSGLFGVPSVHFQFINLAHQLLGTKRLSIPWRGTACFLSNSWRCVTPWLYVGGGLGLR